MNQIIGNGAEAIIYRNDDFVCKDRIPKKYRISAIDNKLRKNRTKREGRILEKLFPLGFVPKVRKVEGTHIEIDFLEGDKIRDALSVKNYEKISVMIGNNLAKMHNLNIVHGDLTTSNMILSKNSLFFIDFGLSYVSSKIEDKAVDIHVLKQALDAYHFDLVEKIFPLVLNAYAEEYSEGDLVLGRFRLVEKRGKNKH